MAKDVIIALDFPTREETMAFLDRFPAGKKLFVKIGMELFYAEGLQIVRELKAMGHKVFLDLKLHDIPNTVKRAMGVLSRLDVDMINIHAAGGSSMMKAALEGLARPDGACGPDSGRPLLIAVTQLTSTAPETLKDELLIDTPMEEAVLAYAKNAANSGLDGVVCSPLEAAQVKERCGEAFCTVAPGVRFADGDAGDQKRIMTPEKAGQSGCDYIVMGRPITQAEEPYVAYEKARSAFLYGGEISAWLDAVLPEEGQEYLFGDLKQIHFTLERLDQDDRCSGVYDFDKKDKDAGFVSYGKCGWLLYMQADAGPAHWTSEPLYIDHEYTDYSQVRWVHRREYTETMEPDAVPQEDTVSAIKEYAKSGRKGSVLRQFGCTCLEMVCDEELLEYEYFGKEPDGAYMHVDQITLRLDGKSDEYGGDEFNLLMSTEESEKLFLESLEDDMADEKWNLDGASSESLGDTLDDGDGCLPF